MTRHLKNASLDNSTCWTLIFDAANGHDQAAAQFVTTYEPVVCGYLRSRWPDPLRRSEIADAVQDVFVECIRPKGALERVEQNRVGGFRAFLYGVVRNVALRYETRRRIHPLVGEPIANESSLGVSFDREFARCIMKEASRVQAVNACQAGAAAVRRLELLQLRFGENLPIREIAVLWNENPAYLHHEYATARNEFRMAIQEVVRFHNPDLLQHEIVDQCQELINCLK